MGCQQLFLPLRAGNILFPVSCRRKQTEKGAADHSRHSQMKYRKLLYMKLNVMVAMYCFLCRNIGSHSQYIEQHCLEYNPETLAYLRAKFYTQQQSLVNLSQIFGETPRVHVVYQHCNRTFSTIISSHVKRKHKVIKTDTQIIFTQ